MHTIDNAASSTSDNAVSRTSPQRGEAGRGEQRVWHPTSLPPDLLEAARNLRQHMTDAEQCLWWYLRGKQLDVFRFRKQHPLERFVLDFYCPAARLAIEIDGSQHNTASGHSSDAARTRCLEAHGIRVLRFWNHEVLQHLQGVLERIWEALHKPPSLPPPAGGRMKHDAGARDDDSPPSA
jgi:very-short-patch-repair endonuclease